MHSRLNRVHDLNFLRAEDPGDATAELVNIRALRFPERDGVHLELPDVKRKDLQELKRPGDIVLLRNGQRIDVMGRA